MATYLNPSYTSYSGTSKTAPAKSTVKSITDPTNKLGIMPNVPKNSTPAPSVKGASTSKSSGSSSKSGGGSSASQGVYATNPVTGEKAYYDSESKAIESLYGDASKFLNQQEASTRAGEQDFYNQYTKPYEAQVPLIQQATQEGVGKIESAVGTARQSEQSALAQARRLYNELSQRSVQQFGGVGGSSAGQASSEIANREFLRNVGGINQSTAQQVQDLYTQSRDLEQKSQAQLQSLNLQKEVALSQAREAFRKQLDAINSQRFELSQNKAQAKLSLLQNFRQRVQSVNDQARALEQNLIIMREQAGANIAQALQSVQAQAGQMGGYASQGLADLNQQLGSQQSNYSTVGGQQPINLSGLFGYMPTAKKNNQGY